MSPVKVTRRGETLYYFNYRSVPGNGILFELFISNNFLI